LTRGIENHEDLVIQYTPQVDGVNSAEVTTTNKDMTECSSGDYNFNLTDTKLSSITVRAKRLDPSSSYSILIVQEGVDLGSPSTLTSSK